MWKCLPDGMGLWHGVGIIICSWTSGNRAQWRFNRARIANDSKAQEFCFYKARRRNHVVGDAICLVLCCDQNWVRLTHVDVKIIVVLLNGVRPFSLNKPHHMPLNSEVERRFQAHVWNSKPVCSPYNLRATLAECLPFKQIKETLPLLVYIYSP